MKQFQAIFFDLNGTLIDIWTDETRDDLYRTMSNLLATYGVDLAPDRLHEEFFSLQKEQRKLSHAEHPEFDVVKIFLHLLSRYGGDAVQKQTAKEREQLAVFLSHAFRAASMFKLQTYPGVVEVLTELKKQYRLAAVSDAQRLWAVAEMRRCN